MPQEIRPLTPVDPARLRRAWLAAVICACALFIGATAVLKLGIATGRLEVGLRLLTLSVENNAGAWFSSMLLLLIALHAWDGVARHRATAPRVARAWAAISAILVFLSFDELASLHERLMDLGVALGLGKWALLLILAGAIGLAFLRAIAALWAGGSAHRRDAAGLLLGFGLLGTIVVQEYAEHQSNWQFAWQQALRVALEEGTELAGMVVLLAVAMRNSGPFRAEGRPFLAALDDLRRPLLVAGLVAAPVLAYATGLVEADKRGRPADWVAAAAFALAALWLLRPSLAQGRRDRIASLAAGLCLLASVASVRWRAGITVEILGMEVAIRLAVVLALGLLIAALSPGRARQGGLMLLLAGAASLVTPAGWPVYLLGELAGLAMLATLAAPTAPTTLAPDWDGRKKVSS